MITIKKNMTIYYHHDFDGIASATFLTSFFNSQEIFVKKLVAVDYNQIDGWMHSKLIKPAAVVDFPFHPDAEFWFDHHELATSLLNVISLSTKLVHDPSYKSCAALIHDHLQHTFSYHAPQYSQMIAYANLIDSSDYANPDAALACNNLWEKISLVVQLYKNKNLNNEIIQSLVQKNGRFKKIFTQIPRLQTKLDRALIYRQGQIETLRQKAVLLVDRKILIHPEIEYAFHKYLPFCTFPDVILSIGMVNNSGFPQTIVCKNPWKRNIEYKDLNIGALCEKFGGGGHPDRGGIPSGSKSNVSRHIKAIFHLIGQDPESIPIYQILDTIT